MEGPGAGQGSSAPGMFSLSQRDSHFLGSCGSQSIRSHPAKLCGSPASAKCPEPGIVCRPFLGFLKVNIVLGERSASWTRGEACSSAKLWKIPGKWNFYFPLGGSLASLLFIWDGKKNRKASTFPKKPWPKLFIFSSNLLHPQVFLPPSSQEAGPNLFPVCHTFIWSISPSCCLYLPTHSESTTVFHLLLPTALDPPSSLTWIIVNLSNTCQRLHYRGPQLGQQSEWA